MTASMDFAVILSSQELREECWIDSECQNDSSEELVAPEAVRTRNSIFRDFEDESDMPSMTRCRSTSNLFLLESQPFGPLREITNTNVSDISAPKTKQACDSQESVDGRGEFEYASDILEVLVREEPRHALRPEYMHAQDDIDERMRAILVDWIIDVHRSYESRPATLFVTVCIIDHYLSCRQVSRPELQLVGATALFIASKYEDVSPIRTQDLVYVTDNAYEAEEILSKECEMLVALGFRIPGATAAHFLMHFLGDQRADLAWCMLELALLDIQMMRHMPSHLAAAALLASKAADGSENCPHGLVQLIGQAGDSLFTCMDEMQELCRRASQSPYHTLQDKYNHLDLFRHA